jgi:phosphoglycolate phosphatase
MLTAVLFDLDGTLVDSSPGVLLSLTAVTALGRPPVPTRELPRFLGPPLQDGLAELLGLGGPALDEAVRVYRTAYRAGGILDCTVYPGIHALLDDLRTHGLRLAVATSKPEPFAERVLEHVGLAAAFEVVRGASLDGTVRHKEQVVRAALTALDVEPVTAVLVGDREHDVLGARAVGLDCLGAGWGFGGRGELAAAGAALVADRPADLVDELVRRMRTTAG